MSVNRVMVIGPGRLGRTLAGALLDSDDDLEVVVAGRHPEPPEAPLFDGRVRYVFGVEQPAARTSAVLLTVPEYAVPEVAQALAAQGRAPEGCAAFHCSGSLPTDALEPLHHAGYAVGALHPLLAVTDPVLDRQALADAWFSVTGGPEALVVARAICRTVGARMFTVPAARRPTVHAAAVLASTMMLPLLARSTEMMQRAGIDGDEALAALLPLVRSTVDAIQRGGVPDSIRGPIARGDVEAVSLHLRTLDEDEARLYATLGAEIVKLSEGVLDPEVRAAFDELFARTLHLEPTTTGY